MSNQPIVEIIEVEPRWITAQRVRDELVASERAAARESGLPTNFDRRDLDEWLDALAFDIAPVGEWLESVRVFEAFKVHLTTRERRSVHIAQGEFLTCLGSHLRERFLHCQGEFKKFKSRYNITSKTSESLKSRAIEYRTNRKMTRAKQKESGHSGQPSVVASESRKYMNEFLKTKCSIILLENELFPDAKELSESFGAFNACRKHLGEFKMDDESISLISVGDGMTPRTAALFALRTSWHCIAIDPKMGLSKKSKQKYDIARLQFHRAKIEEVRIRAKKAIIVMVHAHISLAKTVASVTSDDGTAACIALPCCNYYASIDAPNRIEYSDIAVLSPHRTVRVWKRLSCSRHAND